MIGTEPDNVPVPPKFHLSLLIHAHQPVGNFEDIMERCYQRGYLPFAQLLEKHPAIRVALHYSGFEPSELFGAYQAEDRGKNVRVFAGQKALRYLIPWEKVSGAVAYLKETAATHPDGIAVFGDDMEKFGVWPGTYEHCYTDHWLEDFFTALEANADWLSLTPPSEYAETHAPLGRADLPAAS